MTTPQDSYHVQDDLRCCETCDHNLYPGLAWDGCEKCEGLTVQPTGVCDYYERTDE